MSSWVAQTEKFMQIIADEKKIRLPERESQVLSLAAQGLTDKQIAADLGISQETVGTYWRRILLRFGAASRTEVVAKLAESEAKGRIEQAEAQKVALQREVSVHASAHAEETAKRTLAEAIKEASLNFIGGTTSISATFEQVLESILTVTESQYGFIAEVLYDDNDGVPYLRTLALSNVGGEQGDPPGMGFEFRNLDSLYGRVIKSETAYISDDPQNDRNFGGLPPGHPPLASFLGMPIHLGPGLVGVIGLANKPGGYPQYLVDHLEPIAVACARLISAYRADAAWQEAEKEIVASAHRLNLLMDSLTSGVLFGDREGRVEFVNQAFCRLFGLPCSPFELIGSDCATNAAAMSALFVDEGFGDRVKSIVSAGDPVTSEILELKDGRVFARDFLPIDVYGELRGYLWHFRDVTARVRETKTLSAILDAVSDAVVVVDESGTVKIWNKSACELFGYEPSAAIGQDLADLVVPKTMVKQYRVGMRMLLSSAESQGRSLRVAATNRDGKVLNVELSVTPLGTEGSRLFAAFIRPV